MTRNRMWLRSKAMLPLWVAIALVGDLPSRTNQTLLSEFGPSSAFADDDDDGGDDGDNGGGSGGSATYGRPGGINLFRALRDRFAPRAQRRAPRRAAPLPSRAPDEIVASGLGQTQLDQLIASGFSLLERDALASLGSELVKLRIPPNLSLETARERVAAAGPQTIADFNHYYRPDQENVPDCNGRHCLAAKLVGWPVSIGGLPPACGSNVTIGLIDTAINPAHAAFARGQVEVVRLSGDDLPESGRQHGTAVAALLVGSAESQTPGLLPGARLIAVDAFHRGGRQDDRSDVFDLMRAVDLLSQRRVDVVNMSLSGPANTLLEQLVRKVATSGTVMVAAAGNKGPSAEPVYPAAYADVIAVTAIDRNKRAYRRAGRGDHIDLAAPGVDVWTAASIRGARPKTGTSFAAPFVTAAVALMKSADKAATAAQIGGALGKSAEDLGEPGKDAIFGWGLLNARAACGVTAENPKMEPG